MCYRHILHPPLDQNYLSIMEIFSMHEFSKCLSNKHSIHKENQSLRNISMQDEIPSS